MYIFYTLNEEIQNNWCCFVQTSQFFPCILLKGKVHPSIFDAHFLLHYQLPTVIGRRQRFTLNKSNNKVLQVKLINLCWLLPKWTVSPNNNAAIDLPWVIVTSRCWPTHLLSTRVWRNCWGAHCSSCFGWAEPHWRCVLGTSCLRGWRTWGLVHTHMHTSTVLHAARVSLSLSFCKMEE